MNDQEFVIHAALVEHIRWFRQVGVVFFHSPNGEERTKRVNPKTGGTRLQRMGVRKGVPDFVILHSCRIMGLEVKEPDGTLSREQKEFRDEWIAAGGIYGVAKSVEEGTALLKAWGVIKAGGSSTSYGVQVKAGGRR